MALYEIALEQFFKEKPHLLTICCKPTEDIQHAWSGAEKTNRSESVRLAHHHLLQALYEENVLHQLEAWVTEMISNAMLKSVINYLHWVETMLFIAASRNFDLALHLEAGEALSKLCLTFDRIKYNHLWPLYIADMHELKTKHPKTWKKLQSGNLSVTKSVVPFVSIGADHACEHLNKMIKGSFGLSWHL